MKDYSSDADGGPHVNDASLGPLDCPCLEEIGTAHMDMWCSRCRELVKSGKVKPLVWDL